MPIDRAFGRILGRRGAAAELHFGDAGTTGGVTTSTVVAGRPLYRMTAKVTPQMSRTATAAPDHKRRSRFVVVPGARIAARVADRLG